MAPMHEWNSDAEFLKYNRPDDRTLAWPWSAIAIAILTLLLFTVVNPLIDWIF